MTNFVHQSSSEFSNDASPVEGDPLITNGAGNLLSLILEYQSIDFAGQQKCS